MSNDEYVQQQVGKVLRHGETVELSAVMVNAPPLWLQALLLGVIFSWLLSTYYFVVLTNERLILIKTKMGLMGLRQDNQGVESYERTAITRVSTGGFMNNRSMTFHGPNLKLRIIPRSKPVSTQGRFFKEVPKLFSASEAVGSSQVTVARN